MDRDVAEMKIGRETARDVVLGFVAVLGVFFELIVKKIGELLVSGAGATACLAGRDGVVDGEGGERFRVSSENFTRCFGPAVEDVLGYGGIAGDVCLRPITRNKSPKFQERT